MKEVFLSLGGNIGDVKGTFCQALGLLRSLPQIKNLRISGLYCTSPVGRQDVPAYINCVVGFDCGFAVRELFGHLQQIEKAFGRSRSEPCAPRRLDIDILFFGSDTVCEDDLQIPHPRMQERLFVLVPLLELTQRVGKFDIARQIERILASGCDQQVQLIEDRSWNS